MRHFAVWGTGLSRRKSITWWITANILVFVALLLTIIFISHTFILPSLYRWQRTKTVAEAVTELGGSLNSPYFSRTLAQIAREQSACIRVLQKSGTEVYSLDYMPYSTLKDMSKSELFDLWYEANGGGGTHSEIYAMDSARLKRLVPSGVNAIIYVRSFEVEGREPVAIFYNSTITPIDGMMEVLRIELWWIMGIAIVFTAALAVFVSRSIAQPITRINDQARRLKNQDYSVVFDSNTYREVAELSDTLNATNREMELLDGLRRELIANVSHDLRTPLSMIIAYAEVMRDVPGENTPENVQTIIDEANRLSELVSGVLLIPDSSGKSDGLSLVFYDYTSACRSIIERYRKFNVNSSCEILYEGPAHLQIRADRVKLSQVIYNLLNNAIAHAGDSAEIKLKVMMKDGRVRTEIIDFGEGIPEEKLPLIWEDYYSDTDDEGYHTGIGLSIVRRILELHKARYGVKSRLGEGSTFWFEIDCYET